MTELSAKHLETIYRLNGTDGLMQELWPYTKCAADGPSIQGMTLERELHFLVQLLCPFLGPFGAMISLAKPAIKNKASCWSVQVFVYPLNGMEEGKSYKPQTEVFLRWDVQPKPIPDWLRTQMQNIGSPIVY